MRAMLLLCLLVIPTAALGNGGDMSSSIQEVKKQHEARFLAMPSVVSVGIGLTPDGRQAIIVGMNKKHPETEVKIPSVLDGYPVRIKITGPIRAQ